ncbi:glycosyltransferase family 2 protein [Desulfitobacterium dichloroeliminans]|nr:glycosyltransferase [Desulfitobacterium dichloroeliminans]
MKTQDMRNKEGLRMGGNMLPKVSVIIPVYNGSKYMREAIDSALGQTYPSIEVIVVNDGSKDGGATNQIALSYGNRIRYLVKENGGVSTALNLAIEKMNGEYFSWLSHDDVYYPQKIEVQLKYLLEQQLKDTIIYGGYELINKLSQTVSQVKPDSLYTKEQLNIPLLSVFRGLINGCTLLIPKSHFEKVGLFDENLPLTQDYDLWFKMFRQAQVHFLPGSYVRTRIHDEQQTHRKEELTLKECNGLWTSLINKITIKEMCEIDGSPYTFYQNTAEFLRKFTNYTEAQNYAEALARKAKGKISVIIPFYNRIPLLIETIRSVLAQTYTNFEIILIDDGSTDDISPIRMLKDPRIHYVYQKHQGVSIARNLGISLSSGEYIAFLDSDDLFLINKLEKQLHYMEGHGLAFSHTSYQRMSMLGIPREVVPTGRFTGKVFPRILASCGIATPTVMIKREILINRTFDESIDFGEDVCLWIDIAYTIPVGGIDEPLTLVRVGRQTSAFNIEKQRIAYRKIYEHIMKNPHYRIYEREIQNLLKDYNKINKNDENWSKFISKHIHIKAN